MMQLVLSLFPGIGLLDMAFEEEGFCIVRGPDLLWGGDIRRFHPPTGKFDGVIGGPPCQAFSVMRYINPLAGAKTGNLIPEFERVILEAEPAWFLMENVRDAPVPRVEDYFVESELIRDVWVGGATLRMRRFSFGLLHADEGRNFAIEQVALHTQEPEVSALAGGGAREVPVKLQRDGKGGHIEKKRYGNSGKRSCLGYGGNSGDGLKYRLAAQGLPEDFLQDAPFTAAGKSKAIGNGVPLPMGRAVARAVKRALGIESAIVRWKPPESLRDIFREIGA
jgi:DNA (cytosine-5)-methyltransferase 1